MKEPPIPIQKGLRQASLNGVQLIGQPNYIDHKSANDKWAIEVELSLILGSEKQIVPFPISSRWFMVVDYDYPYGDVDIYPAKNGGIKETYHHQALNCELIEDLPWRKGKICLDKPIQGLGFIAGHHDPIGNYEERLMWHLQRALAWIHAAATNSLVKAGDPFETPYYSYQDDTRYVNDESSCSFAAWTGIKPGDWGFLIWDSLEGIDKTEFAIAYFKRNRALVRATPKYNECIHKLDNPETKQGLWWLWPSPVVLYPWQAPVNWGELRRVGKTMGINVDYCLRGINKILQGQEATPLYIGYPIPKRYGDGFSEIHWQAIMLPKMLPRTDGQKKPPRGFRSFERWQWWLESTSLFSNKEQLKYMETENWHPDRLQARGRLSQPLREAKIALIGCGALGSIMAELLVRGGVGDILFIDHQILEAGNLVRHTLSGQDIGEQKAVALARRLISTSPFAKISVRNSKFPTEQFEVTSLIEDYDLVIDCTADDKVVHALNLGYWSLEKLFLSVSVGYKARRTFLFAHQGQSFPLRVFQSLLEPLLQGERVAWADDGETLEGAGCWSPLFPARMDDLMLAASSTIKVLEELVAKREPGTRFMIFEQVSDENFQGLKRMEVPAEQDRVK